MKVKNQILFLTKSVKLKDVRKLTDNKAVFIPLDKINLYIEDKFFTSSKKSRIFYAFTKDDHEEIKKSLNLLRPQYLNYLVDQIAFINSQNPETFYSFRNKNLPTGLNKITDFLI